MSLTKDTRLPKEPLSTEEVSILQSIAALIRSEAIELIDRANSGHIGGSMSSADIIAALYAWADLTPERMAAPDRDRLIIGMGHVSPVLYCTLMAYGYINKDELFEKYRRLPGIYEGHPNNLAPGVEWGNGCLGQGLSQGCGVALAQKKRGMESAHVYVLMGDGEQAKGQIQEAIEFAAAKGLSNLTAIVDLNGEQSSGDTKNVMPVPIAGRYRAANWKILEINGHDYEQIRIALQSAQSADVPTCILAHTVMGKGVPEIENDWRYHGKLLTNDQAMHAVERLRSQSDSKVQLPVREWCGISICPPDSLPQLEGIDCVRSYGTEEHLDGRKACANALKDLVAENPNKICVVDCDLASGLGIDQLNRIVPESLVECGIQEHNAVSMAGGMISAGIRTFFMDFGVFALGEVFNQLRVLDQNHIPIKIIASHCGLDVGFDGKSHQYLDYIATGCALFGFDLVLPADPNQTDRALRWLAATDRPGILAVPRSTLPVLTDEHGEPLFGDSYRFEYGKADWIRKGRDAVIIGHGIMVHYALKAALQLEDEGIMCGVLNITAPKCLDEEKICEAAQKGCVFVVEDHNKATGLGKLIGSYLEEKKITCTYKHMAVEEYGISASSEAQFEKAHMTANEIAGEIRTSLQM